MLVNINPKGHGVIYGKELYAEKNYVWKKVIYEESFYMEKSSYAERNAIRGK